MEGTGLQDPMCDQEVNWGGEEVGVGDREDATPRPRYLSYCDTHGSFQILPANLGRAPL